MIFIFFKNKNILLFFCLLFCSELAFGQSTSQYWNTSNGLSNNWVSDITQDEEGYIWIATQYGLNRFDGYAFKIFQYEPNDSNSLSSNWVRKIEQDSDFFWLNAYLGGLNRFHQERGITNQNWFYENGSRIKVVRSLFVDAEQTVWLSSPFGFFRKKSDKTIFEKMDTLIVYDIQEAENGNLFLLAKSGIYEFDKVNKQFQKLADSSYPNVQSIFIDGNNDLWWLKESELRGLSKRSGHWEKKTIVINNTPLKGLFTKTPIFEDSQKRLWVGGEKGITIVEPERGQSETTSYESFFPNDVPLGKALCFFEDHHHNIWTGTTNGVFLQSPFIQRLAAPEHFPSLNSFHSVRGILQTNKELWLASEQGLFKLDLEAPTTLPQKILSGNSISLLKSKDNQLYVGGQNLYKIDLEDLQIKQIPKGKQALRGEMIWSLAEDAAGKIWIGNQRMLQSLDPKQSHFEYFSKEQIPELVNSPSQVLLVDSKGRLWAGSLQSGLYLFEKPGSTSFQRFYYDENQPKSLSHNLIVALAEGKDGVIWVGTDGGLNRIDPNSLEVKRYLKKDGLIDEKIMGLLIDDSGNVWGSTIGHGIFRFNVETEEFTFFNKKDGLLSNNFLLSSHFKNQDGKLFFGSDNGVQIIDPVVIEHFQKPRIQFQFTALTLSDSTINLTKQEEISLPFHCQTFTVHYSTINYFQAMKTTYSYQLEGLHDDWQSNGRGRELSFTGLGAGDYILKVKALNPDLIFEEAVQTLSIKILPPWWKTVWAYTSYIMAFLVATGLIYKMQLKRQLEKVEAKRLQELDTMKTRFFTNITHEFRTPLTVILGLANKLKTHSKKDIASKAQLIWRNGQQVLDLINQILEASKLKAGKLPVEYVNGDLLQYLNYLVESFHSLAASKNIRLHLLPEVSSLYMDYDAEKIKQITANLISNAIRFTPQGGDIYIQIKATPKQAELIFRDTGKGINKEHLPYIFERFYQVEHSEGNTGIGLSFTKELVLLFGGKIKVESILGHGTTFRIHLPIENKVENPAQIPYIETTKPTTETNQFDNLNTMHSEDVPLLLLIEDNEDVLYYLVDCLKMDYRIDIAKNGEEGIQKAQAQIPDLIISDVMMPKKDGYEVCRTIKKEVRTSHIPIILLTAKAGQSSKIEGLELGADAYLSKPFEKDELLVRIKKLLEIRRQLQKRFQQVALGDSAKTETNNTEGVFVTKVRDIIQQHLSDSNFGIPQLCRKLGISRVHLHRKLKALTNQSTSHFIRNIRLQKAKKLLQSTDLNVSEVAYEVGFADPAYFSKVYSEAFGESPNVTRN